MIYITALARQEKQENSKEKAIQKRAAAMEEAAVKPIRQAV